MPIEDYTSPKETGAYGSNYENLVAGYLMSCMLAQTQFDTDLGPPDRIDFQTNGRNWRDIDDLLITEQFVNTRSARPRRLALSLKTAQQIRADKFPAEFVNTCWDLLLAKDTPFDRTNDFLGICTTQFVDATRNAWVELSAWSRTKHPADLKSAVNRPGESNAKYRKLYQSFKCPGSKSYLTQATEIDHTDLISRVRAYKWLLSDTAAPERIQALENCKKVLVDPTEAQSLWSSLLEIAQEHKQASGSTTPLKLFAQLHERFALKSADSILVKNEAELVAELKSSEHRCISSWMLLGLREDEAIAFTEDAAVGNLKGIEEEAQSAPITIVEAAIGHGKTLGAERALQTAIRRKIIEPDAPYPVLWKARLVHEDLISRIQSLSNTVNDLTRSYLIIVDGLDEIDYTLSTRLVVDCVGSARTYSTLSLRFLLLSRPLSNFDIDIPRIPAPALTDEEADSLFERVAGQPPIWRTDQQPAGVREILNTPLFVILLALYIREKHLYRMPTYAELVNYLIDKKLSQLDKRLDSARATLAQIAHLVLESPTQLIDRVQLQHLAPLSELSSIGLLSLDGTKLTFALQLLTEYFGAQYLHTRILGGSKVPFSPKTIDRWLPSIKLFLETASFDEIASLMAQVAECSSAHCFLAMEDTAASHRLFQTEGYSHVDSMLMAQELRRAMKTWVEALGLDISRLTAPVDENGNLLPLGITSNPILGWIGEKRPARAGAYAWRYSGTTKDTADIFELSSFIDEVGRDSQWQYFRTIHGTSFSTKPNVLWNDVRGEISLQIEKSMQSRALLTLGKEATSELMWGSALVVTGADSIASAHLSVPVLTRAASPYLQSSQTIYYRGLPIFPQYLTGSILVAYSNGLDEITSPYPTIVDFPRFGRPLTASDIDQIVSRTSMILARALLIYQELVEKYFRSIASRLNMYCLLPVRMVGKLNILAHSPKPKVRISYTVLPNELDKQTHIDLAYSPNQDWLDAGLYELARKAYLRLSVVRPHSCEFVHLPISSRLIDIVGRYPALDWAYSILSEDLKSINVVHNKFKTEAEEASSHW